jgi:hypothetical protein
MRVDTYLLCTALDLVRQAVRATEHCQTQEGLRMLEEFVYASW